MTSDSPRRRPRRVSGGIAQLPWRAITNPSRPVEILSADQVETIQLASLRILREIGFEILGDSALELFAGAGAEVDWARRSVRLDDVLVEELVAKAPAEFRLERGRRPGSV
jgi:trimethylamine--corrinoid protein Co-methyltransferase